MDDVEASFFLYLNCSGTLKYAVFLDKLYCDYTDNSNHVGNCRKSSAIYLILYGLMVVSAALTYATLVWEARLPPQFSQGPSCTVASLISPAVCVCRPQAFIPFTTRLVKDTFVDIVPVNFKISPLAGTCNYDLHRCDAIFFFFSIAT